MRRGSYSTPFVSDDPVSRPSLGPAETRSFIWSFRGTRVTLSVNPMQYVLPVLAAELADAWLDVAYAVDAPKDELLGSVRVFVADVGAQLRDARGTSTFGLTDLRRRHLDQWETHLLAQHRSAGSDTAYRKNVNLLALLTKIASERPDLLHPEVLQRLESVPRLWHHRNEGMPAFAPEELGAMRKRAYQLVRGHLVGPQTSTTGISPPTRVLVAAQILLCLTSGEPPESVRALTSSDVIATATPEGDAATRTMTPVRRLTWLVVNDQVQSFAVSWRKRRGHVVREESVTRRQHALFHALGDLVLLTAHLRGESASDALWVRRNASGDITAVDWNLRSFSLSAWLEREGIDVEGPHHLGRFRKQVTGEEAVADPGRYLHGGRRHSARTFHGHYTNNPAMRALAGRVLLDASEDLFNTAVSGPTVVPSAVEEMLVRGQSVPGIEKAEGDALVHGELDGALAACRDPVASPFAPSGKTCPLSMTGTCFSCVNALVVERHLPGVLAVAEIADPARAGDVRVWREQWELVWEAIQYVILPAFSEESIARARAHVSDVPLALGTVNDLRGLRDVDDGT